MSWGGWSASAVGRLLGCPTSFALPQGRETGDWAERGIVLHDFCRTIQVNPAARAQALLDIADEDIRKTAEGINLAAALDGIEVVACERAYVLNVKNKTVRTVGDNIDRKYDETLIANGQEPLGKYDVPCSMDVVGTVLGGVPCEVDYKSGRPVGPVKDHFQTRVCAAILLILHEVPVVVGRVAYIWEDGTVMPDGDEFSALDVDDLCDEIVAAIDAVDKAKALLASGIMPKVEASDENCKYCPAVTSCPHHMNFVRSLLGELVQIEKGPDLKTVPVEDLGKAFDMMKKAVKVLERIEKAGKLVGSERPLPVDDKYEYRSKDSPGRKFFDAAKARGEIVKLMGQAGADEEAIAAKLESLNGKGASFPVFSKVKRVHLPVVNQEQKRAS